ncbi:mediator complex subunit [Massospora cicadina]|nr:mediator complex subunit [Massospora cicadina]
MRMTEAYDVLSSVDVFYTGSYNQMPSSIKERFVPPAKIKPEQVAGTLDLLNDIVFRRYLKVEGIPDCLKGGIRIENGKLILSLSQRYEVILTLLGPDMELPWHLVAIKLFVAGEGPGFEPGQETLFTLPQYQRIMYFAQQSLLPPHLRDEQTKVGAAAKSSEAGAGASSAPDLLGNKTPYIGNLHDYLQNFCSSLQLEILHGQAALLASHRWKDQLKVDLVENHTCLKLSYWSKFPPLSFDSPLAALDRDKSHYILIRKPEGSELTLKAEWLRHRYRFADAISPAEKELVFDPTRLNVEKALRKVIRLHSKFILLRLRGLLLAPARKGAQHLIIQSKQTRRLRLTVDFRSGRLKMYMDNEMGGELRLLELEALLNDRPAEIEQTLQQWWLKRIVDNIRFVATANGLETAFKLPLTASDLNKFGTIQKAAYIRLSNIPDSYLAVALVANHLKAWLPEKQAIAHNTPRRGPDALLDKLLRLCEGHHLANEVEKQLSSIAEPKRSPPFASGAISAPPCLLTHAALSATGALSPAELERFAGSQHLARLFSISPESLSAPLSAATPFVVGPVAVYAAPSLGRWVAFSCLLRSHQLPGLPETAIWLTFLYADFNGCVAQFLLDWLAFVTATKLYLEVAASLGDLEMAAVGYDLQSVSIRYHEHYVATVGFATLERPLALALHANHPQGYWNPHLRILPFLESSLNATFSLRQLLLLLKHTLPVVSALDEYERRLIRPFNVVPLSCTHFRLVFAVTNSIDLVLVSPTQVLVRDGGLSESRPLPLPWRPASRPAPNAQSLLFRPAVNAYMPLYAAYLPTIIRRFADCAEPKEFLVSGGDVAFDVSLVLAALQSYDWFFNLLHLFQRAHAVFKDPSRLAPPALKRIEDFELSYPTPTCHWALRARDGLSSVVFEPTTPPPPTPLLDGTLPPLSMDDLALLSKFLSGKINTMGHSQASMQAAHMLTFCPALVLREFVEALRFIDAAPAALGIAQDLKLEWHLTMPSPSQLSHPGLPRAGTIVFAYSPADSQLKCLFSIRRGDTVLALPLHFHTGRRSLSVWNAFTRDPTGSTPIVQRPALSNLIQRADRDLPMTGLRISGLLEHICRLPYDDFRYAAS